MKNWFATACFLAAAISGINGTCSKQQFDGNHRFENTGRGESSCTASLGFVQGIVNVTITKVNIFSENTTLQIYGRDIEPKVNSCIIVTLPESNCVIQGVNNSCIVINTEEGVPAVQFNSSATGEILQLKYTKEDCDTETGNVSTQAVTMSVEYNSTLMQQGTSEEITTSLVSSTESMTDTSITTSKLGRVPGISVGVPLSTPENAETTSEDQITAAEVGTDMKTIGIYVLVGGVAVLLIFILITIPLLIKRRRNWEKNEISTAPVNHVSPPYENQGFSALDGTTHIYTNIPPPSSSITPNSQAAVDVAPTYANVNPSIPKLKASTLEHKIEPARTDRNSHYEIMKPGTSNSHVMPKRTYRPSAGDIPFLITSSYDGVSNNIPRHSLPNNAGFRSCQSLDRLGSNEPDDMYVDVGVEKCHLNCPNYAKRHSYSTYVNITPSHKLNPNIEAETYVTMRSVPSTHLNPGSSTPDLRTTKSYLQFWQPRKSQGNCYDLASG